MVFSPFTAVCFSRSPSRFLWSWQRDVIFRESTVTGLPRTTATAGKAHFTRPLTTVSSQTSARNLLSTSAGESLKLRYLIGKCM